MKKKTFLLILISFFCMCTSIVLTGCFGGNDTTPQKQPPREDAQYIDDFIFYDGVEGFGVSKYVGRAADVVIPAYNRTGLKVETINSYIFKNLAIKSIVIPETVKFIGSDAFKGCTSLTKVVFKGTLDQWCDMTMKSSPIDQTQQVDLYINDELVSGDIVIKEGIEQISVGLFKNQSNITSITLPSTLKVIEDYAFYNLNQITRFTIPKNVEEIGDYAFYKCEKLAEVNNQSTVLSSLGLAAFAENKELLSFVIPNTLNNISSETFRNCIKLHTVTITGAVYTIGDNAFSGCVSLKNIELPSTLVRIDQSAFKKCESLTKITLSPTITKIDYYTFSGCSGLQKVICHSNIEKFQDGAFAGCVNLKTIEKADKTPMASSKFFGSGCFASCENLETNLMGENTETIEYNAFGNCKKITKVNLGEKIQLVDLGAFRDCSGLVEVYIENPDLEIDSEWLFGDTVFLEKLTAPQEVLSYLENKSMLEEVHITKCTSLNSELIDECVKLKTLKLPATLSSIEADTFLNVDTITNIHFMGTIDDWCAVTVGTPLADYTTNFYINDVKVVGEDCPELEVIFNDEKTYSNFNCTVVSDYAFYKFSNLKKVVLHEGVKIIGGSAFANCAKLEELEFGIAFQTAERDAFLNCVNLKKLNYVGTVEDWCKIDLEYKTNAPTYYGAQLYFNGTIIPSELVIGSSVKTIGRFAFTNQKNVTSIIIDSDNVNAIQIFYTSIFAGCSNVIYGKGCVGLFNGLMRSDEYTPATKLETALIIDMLKGRKIDDKLFENCTNLAEIKISVQVSSIGKDAFLNTAYYNNEENWIGGVLYIDSISSTGGVENVYAIAGNTQCVVNGTLTLQGNVKYIADYAFDNLGIKSIVFSGNLCIIGKYAFQNNQIRFLDLSTTRIDGADDMLLLASGSTRICDYAFADNDMLLEVELSMSSSNAYRISRLAFAGCESIIRVLNTQSSSATSFSHIPCVYYTRSTSDTTFYTSNDLRIFQVYSENQHWLVDYFGSSEDYEVTIDKITEVWYHAFDGDSTLKTLSLNCNLNYENAIVNCDNLESVAFNDSVNSIKGKAFANCEKLTKLYVSVGTWTDGSNTFEYTGETDAEEFAQFVIGKDATITKVQ